MSYGYLGNSLYNLFSTNLLVLITAARSTALSFGPIVVFQMMDMVSRMSRIFTSCTFFRKTKSGQMRHTFRQRLVKMLSLCPLNNSKAALQVLVGCS
jgi:hypothetical protein